jgi:glutaredoxin
LLVQTRTPIEVVFYTKTGCHLCEDARTLLEEVAQDIEYALTEIDIRSDMAVFERYRYRIPVILINGDTLLEGRIDALELTQAFRRSGGT